MNKRYCNECKVQLTYKNSYIKSTSNNLCHTHYYEYKYKQIKQAGYSAMKKYELKNNKTEKRKRQLNETAKKMYLKYPEKWKARAKVSYAVKVGKLVKSSFCENCLSEVIKLQAHHEDYSQPLKVTWLCMKCHTEKHHGFTTIK